MYNRDEMRVRLRDMLRSMGIDVPDELPKGWVIIRDRDGNIIERRRTGEAKEESAETDSPPTTAP